MRYGRKISSVFMIISFLFFGFGLPKNIQKKVDREIENVLGLAEFEMQPIGITDELNATLPVKITEDNFFALSNGAESIGYAFVDKAPSKTAQFDYLVLFDKDLKVIHSKVLVYREEYGGEIGSKRWLRQFLGKTGKDRVSHETNIDGIAGATISVRSMTKSMDDLLQTIGILQVNKAL